MVFVVPNTCCSKIPITFFICCLQYAWTHVITRFGHGIQLDSVQWDHRGCMVGHHNHVSTASSQL